MIHPWYTPLLQQTNCQALTQLLTSFNLMQFSDWPNAVGLNDLRNQYLQESAVLSPEFICQSVVEDCGAYYEQIIYQQGRIPTRPDNWHDLFNGLIWMQFPKTKALLNQLHIKDIDLHGLHPRSARRNNVTHFDECGIILAIEAPKKDARASSQYSIPELLRQHQWQKVFVDHRGLWGRTVHSFMFGHANLEMLLQPFIGLTGKWLAVEVPYGFANLPLGQQHTIVDETLSTYIYTSDLFADKKSLRPLPILGIPGLTDANNDPAYYQNTDYFRPLNVTKFSLKDNGE